VPRECHNRKGREDPQPSHSGNQTRLRVIRVKQGLYETTNNKQQTIRLREKHKTKTAATGSAGCLGGAVVDKIEKHPAVPCVVDAVSQQHTHLWGARDRRLTGAKLACASKQTLAVKKQFERTFGDDLDKCAHFIAFRWCRRLGGLWCQQQLMLTRC